MIPFTIKDIRIGHWYEAYDGSGDKYHYFINSINGNQIVYYVYDVTDPHAVWVYQNNFEAIFCGLPITDVSYKYQCVVPEKEMWDFIRV
jgi:hypothetical protein